MSSSSSSSSSSPMEIRHTSDSDSSGKFTTGVDTETPITPAPASSSGGPIQESKSENTYDKPARKKKVKSPKKRTPAPAGVNPRGYRFDKQLGEGGASGTVYHYTRGFFMWTHQRAVKKFNKPPEFERETEIYEKLRHPFIVKVYACHETDQTIWMRAYKRNMSDFIQECNSSNSLGDFMLKATKYMVCSAYGLAYIHARGIIHRDIKEGNIFCDSGNRTVIGDYGFAIEERDNTKPMRCGTEGWMAPEVDHQGRSSQKSDVWSWGVTVYHVFTMGQAPWEATPTTSKRNNERPKDMPSMWYYLFQECTKQDPAERPTMERVCTIIERSVEAQSLEDLPEEVASRCASAGDFVPTFDDVEGQLRDLQIFMQDLQSFVKQKMHKAKKAKKLRRNSMEAKNRNQKQKGWDYFRRYGGPLILLLCAYAILGIVPKVTNVSYDDFLTGYFYNIFNRGFSRYQIAVLHLSQVFIAIYLLVGVTLDVKAGKKLRGKSTVCIYIDLLAFIVVEYICCFCRRYPIIVGVSSFVLLGTDLGLAMLYLGEKTEDHQGIRTFGLLFWTWSRTVIIWRLISCIQWTATLSAPVQYCIGITAASIVTLFMISSRRHWLKWIRMALHVILMITYFCAPAYCKDITIPMCAAVMHFLAAVSSLPFIEKFLDRKSVLGRQAPPVSPFMIIIMVVVNLFCLLAMVGPTLAFCPQVMYRRSRNIRLYGHNDWKRYGFAIFSGVGLWIFALGMFCFFKKSWKAKLLSLNSGHGAVRRKQVIISRVFIGIMLVGGYAVFLTGFHLCNYYSNDNAHFGMTGVALQMLSHYLFEIARRVLFDPLAEPQKTKHNSFLMDALMELPLLIVHLLCFIMVFAAVMSAKSLSMNGALMFWNGIIGICTSVFISIVLRRHGGNSDLTNSAAKKVKWFCWNLFVATLPCGFWIMLLASAWVVFPLSIVLGGIGIHRIVARKMADTTSDKDEPEATV